MDDLISRNALRKKVCGWFHRDPQEADHRDDCAAALCMAIDEAPTIAAEPVRHGRWNTLYLYLHICSECNVESEDRSRYCAHCGARMDAKEDAE